MPKCQAAGCEHEGKIWTLRSEISCSTILNGWLCEHHYNMLLELMRAVWNMYLPEAPTNKTKPIEGT